MHNILAYSIKPSIYTKSRITNSAPITFNAISDVEG